MLSPFPLYQFFNGEQIKTREKLSGKAERPKDKKSDVFCFNPKGETDKVLSIKVLNFVRLLH